MIWLLLLALSSSLLAQETRCESNPLKDKEYWRYAWSLCKTLAVKRLEGIRVCLEKSKSYEEGSKCFERSWIEDLFQQ
jgi:hypothetical protein